MVLSLSARTTPFQRAFMRAGWQKVAPISTRDSRQAFVSKPLICHFKTSMAVAMNDNDSKTQQCTLAATVLGGILANPNVTPERLSEADWRAMVGNAVTAAADIMITVDNG